MMPAALSKPVVSLDAFKGMYGDTTLDVYHQIKVCMAVVVGTTLLYGSDTWVLYRK